MRKIIKSLYGNIALLKAYCPFCKAYSFIIDGCFVCCERKYEDIPINEIKKREIVGETERSYIPLKVKKEILESQEHKCIYCNCNLSGHIWDTRNSKFIKVKIHYDHFVSWNYSQDSHPSNLVASCHICNLIKSDKYFKDIISARDFILNTRIKKGYDKKPENAVVPKDLQP